MMTAIRTAGLRRGILGILCLGVLVVWGALPPALQAQDAAVQVEDETLSMQEFNSQVEMRVQQLKQQQRRRRQGPGQGAEGPGPAPNQQGPSEEVLRSKARDMVKEQVVRQLLLQVHAKNEGITVSKKEVNTEWKKMAKRFDSEEDFKQAIERQGMTESKLRDDLKESIRARKLVQRETGGVEVSDQEARQFFNDNKNRMGDQSFEQMKGRIKQMLRQQKQRRILNRFVSQLKEQYEVQVNV